MVLKSNGSKKLVGEGASQCLSIHRGMHLKKWSCNFKDGCIGVLFLRHYPKRWVFRGALYRWSVFLHVFPRMGIRVFHPFDLFKLGKRQVFRKEF